MNHAVLENLKHVDFASRYGVVSNPRALHWALSRSSEVRDVRAALNSGAITEVSIQRFAAELLGKLTYGELFPFDIALATLAVVLEIRAGSFAEEFIFDLARLELAELPMSIRVARQSAHRQLAIAGNKSRTIIPAVIADPVDWKPAPKPQRVLVGQSTNQVELGAI
jgi:hypothetical protein